MQNFNYCYLDINILSDSVVFITYTITPQRKFVNFSEAATGGVLWKKLFLNDSAILTGMEKNLA